MNEMKVISVPDALDMLLANSDFQKMLNRKLAARLPSAIDDIMKSEDLWRQVEFRVENAVDEIIAEMDLSDLLDSALHTAMDKVDVLKICQEMLLGMDIESKVRDLVRREVDKVQIRLELDQR